MTNEELKIMLTAKTDRMWMEIRNYYEDIIDFLSDGVDGGNVADIMDISLKLIVSELMVNKEKYESYNIKEYSMDEFIDKTLISSAKDLVLDSGNREKTEEFIDEIRSEMWGYIKKHYSDLVDIILDIKEQDVSLTQEQADRLIECLCIAYIESNFRRIEINYLEQDLN